MSLQLIELDLNDCAENVASIDEKFIFMLKAKSTLNEKENLTNLNNLILFVRAMFRMPKE